MLTVFSSLALSTFFNNNNNIKTLGGAIQAGMSHTTLRCVETARGVNVHKRVKQQMNGGLHERDLDLHGNNICFSYQIR